MKLEPGAELPRGDTGVPAQKLRDLGDRITAIPERINVHKTLARVLEARRKAVDSGENIDWSLAEHLAFASLLDEGVPVRLSGQDSVRGTFSQRHSAVIDQTTEERYLPLNNIRPGQGYYEAIDSALSEEAVLGFEYGYSVADPNTLTLWEAQFGDFANGAQVVVDQFISSAERKWLRMSGLTLLLPHGYEGQGPEHSSARLERYLQLCAEENLQVANCSTPGQLLPHPAPPGEASVQEAADPDDAQVPAPPQEGGVVAEGDGGGLHLPPRAARRRPEPSRRRRRDAEARRRDPPRGDVLGQGLLRPARRPRDRRAWTTSI